MPADDSQLAGLVGVGTVPTAVPTAVQGSAAWTPSTRWSPTTRAGHNRCQREYDHPMGVDPPRRGAGHRAPSPGAPRLFAGRPRGEVLRATVTPLASIFGSGFLIIVPILERALGALAVVGMTAVCALAWFVGSAIRHNVAAAAEGTPDRVTARLERASDLAIVVAYVISVALYLRILAQFVVEYASSGSGAAERILAVAIVAVITAVGLTRGLSGLQALERVALGAVLVLVLAIGFTFAGTDVSRLAGDGLAFPPVPDMGLGSVLLVLGGIVITVQGFETVRYLDGVHPATRIAASRVAQLVAAVVYVVLVAVATPLMGLGTDAGADRELLELVQRVAPLLALPLVMCAVLSQFSAATADTEAGVGNLRVIGWGPLLGRPSYLLVGVVAAVLAATISTSVIIVVASRAFAGYYALQCAVAARTCAHRTQRAGFTALGLVMLAITVLAKPTG